MLEQVYKSYRRKADIVNWKNYNCNDLFFKCIEHEHDDLYEPFFAGIVCRFWGYAGRLYTQCEKHAPFEECHDCIIDSIRYVLKKRVWENKNSSLYGDKTAPDKAMHIAMKRQRSIMLAKHNAYKRQSNFNTLSIDEMHEEFNDSTDGLLFDLVDESKSNIKSYIECYFNNKKYLEGIILDSICFGEYSEFNSVKIANLVKKLTLNDYNDYYSKNYNISKKQFLKVLVYLSNISSKSLSIKINSLLHYIEKDFK